MVKTLILFLSVTGNTQYIAKELVKEVPNADLCSIKMKTTIPKSEFWLGLKFGFFMWLGRGIRYEMPHVNIDAYDQIIVGAPVWMGRTALPIISALTKLNYQHKIKGMFATCGQDPGMIFSDLCEKLKIPTLQHTLALSVAELKDNERSNRKIKAFAASICSTQLIQSEQK